MKERQLIAYCMAKNLRKMTPEDAKMLDVIHVSFGLIKNGKIYIPYKAVSREIERIREMNPNMRFVLSVGGWAADGFSQAASGEAGRELLVRSGIELLKELKLDGIDIDWEYPCNDAAGIAASPEDKPNFTLLLQKFRQELDTVSADKTLSIAAGGEAFFLDGVEMEKAAQYLDYVQLMTYDLRGATRNITGHHSNLFSYDDISDASTDKAVQVFMEAGVPKEKLVIGAAFYGRQWRGVKDTSESHGLGQPAQTTGSTFYGFDQIEAMLQDFGQGYRKYRDEQARAAWLYNGDSFISYEDKLALEEKARYAAENSLYGIMYWEYGQDGNHMLTKVLYDSIK